MFNLLPFSHYRSGDIQCLLPPSPGSNKLLGLDELYMVNNCTNESYLRDALNSAIAMTDASGTIRDQVTGACPEGCRRNPYGNTSDSNATYSSAFEFAGRENDALGVYYSNLYFMRDRYSDPHIARDPAGLAGGINLCAYAGDARPLDAAGYASVGTCDEPAMPRPYAAV